MVIPILLKFPRLKDYICLLVMSSFAAFKTRSLLMLANRGVYMRKRRLRLLSACNNARRYGNVNLKQPYRA